SGAALHVLQTNGIQGVQRTELTLRIPPALRYGVEARDLRGVVIGRRRRCCVSRWRRFDGHVRQAACGLELLGWLVAGGDALAPAGGAPQDLFEIDVRQPPLAHQRTACDPYVADLLAARRVHELCSDVVNGLRGRTVQI